MSIQITNKFFLILFFFSFFFNNLISFPCCKEDKSYEKINKMQEKEMNNNNEIEKQKIENCVDMEKNKCIIDAKQNPLVSIKTKKGEILIELFETDAPNTVANFISLIEKKFYDGLNFHRVVSNFVIQGGCPLKTGAGGPGYCIKLEVNNKLKHLKGYLSMARRKEPDTAGSQFFICLANTPHLDEQYAVFGKVIEGIEVVDNIVQGDMIEKIEIKRKRKEIYKPDVIKEK